MKHVLATITLISCSVVLLALSPAPDDRSAVETIDWWGQIEINSVTNELIALIPPVAGTTDPGCKLVVIIDTSTGAPIVQEIHCDTLPLCKGKKNTGTCPKTKQGTTPGGGDIFGCPCVKNAS